MSSLPTSDPLGFFWRWLLAPVPVVWCREAYNERE
jgi:hypothetical protein